MKFKGSYCLCIKVSESAKIKVGALDMIDFCKGYYVYIGSALNGLKHRINRHVKTSKGEYKAIHWHIDYLLKHQKVEIKNIYIMQSETRTECDISKKISELGRPIKNFGSSDCKCKSHLYQVQNFDIVKSLDLETYHI